MGKVDLKCSLFGRSFSSPLWLGSGSLTENLGRIENFLNCSIGAIVPRTTRFKFAVGRDHHPSYHLQFNATGQWIRNCEWTGQTIDYWLPHLKKLSGSHKIIMSVSGREIDDCVKVCKILDKYDFPLIEVNISCAHSNLTHGFINRDAEHIKKLMVGLKETVATPIAIKLGHSDQIVYLAKTAEKYGADAIVAINTYGPVLDFDITAGKPKLNLGIGGGKGGLSGKAIFLIALTDVADLSSNLKIPVIACGGVTSAIDAVKMIMAGASTVQIYSAAHFAGNQAPEFLNEFTRDFLKWFENNNYHRIKDIRGLLLPFLKKPHRLKKMIPQITDTRCKKCQACKRICLDQAITVGASGVHINHSKCSGCGACVSICPIRVLK